MQISLIREKGTQHLVGFDADAISNLLAKKHEGDVFIPECKNGETWGARDLLKLDAWVLLRTYSPLTTIGYEIKCSRQDFEQDQKWAGYLDLCHIFYFVCPAGLIRAIDLPSRIGLIWVSQTGKLHTKHKPERQEPNTEKLNRLLIYALMARSKIVSNIPVPSDSPQDKLAQIKYFTEKAEEEQKLAHFVKGHVQKFYMETERKEASLSSREYTVKRFEERLAKLGITWDSTKNDWQDTMKVENEIDAIKKQVDIWTIRTMEDVGKRLLSAVETFNKLHKY